MIGDISTTTTRRVTRRQVVAFSMSDIVELAIDRALSDGNGFIGEPATVTLSWGHAIDPNFPDVGRVERSEDGTTPVAKGFVDEAVFITFERETNE